MVVTDDEYTSGQLYNTGSASPGVGNSTLEISTAQDRYFHLNIEAPSGTPLAFIAGNPPDSSTGNLVRPELIAAFNQTFSPGTGNIAIRDITDTANVITTTIPGGALLRPTVGGAGIDAPITLGAAGTTVVISAPTNLPGAGIASTLTLGGVISGAGNVSFTSSANKNALSTVLLTAPGTYTGSTLLDTDGTSTQTQIVVRLGTHNALPTTTVLTIDGQIGAGTGRFAELNLNGFSQQLAGLTNVARSLRVQRIVNSNVSAAATLTINNTSAHTFSGSHGEQCRHTPRELDDGRRLRRQLRHAFHGGNHSHPRRRMDDRDTRWEGHHHRQGSPLHLPARREKIRQAPSQRAVKRRLIATLAITFLLPG